MYVVGFDMSRDNTVEFSRSIIILY